ncbi:hypothetical protein A9Q83_16470 [Alphaproteobacteria bacterium 46_93_T64]|nr:hypothetical protein A9Q83_16470 [Alphaproteobacteria bacterium 46_93_T64]
MKKLLFVLLLVIGFNSSVKADPVPIENGQGLEMTVQLSWDLPVDLDLFLTDPSGETVYFANRKARSGVRMGAMTGCQAVETLSPPYEETMNIPNAEIGVYRISVDYIKDCGSNNLRADFKLTLLDRKTGMQLGQGQSTVKYRLLDTVSWEFEVK